MASWINPYKTPAAMPTLGPLLIANHKIGTIEAAVIDPPCGKVYTTIKLNAVAKATKIAVSAKTFGFLKEFGFLYSLV